MWAKEFNECGKKHYHVALLFNREAYAYPGSYTSADGEYTHNLAMMIMEAWVRARLNIVNHQQYYPQQFSCQLLLPPEVKTTVTIRLSYPMSLTGLTIWPRIQQR
ncbi:YagK/YfjJ domain-containing protein [Enterobacter cloacae complex sp. 301C7]|uniref:YagK/YfjJ domain-containing protein n=1 Tax=Enterobacter cloacae complex sp. 301C7 TaxID=3395848 RepID=UPI003CE76C65